MNLSKKILSWYDNNKRILPWRIVQNFEKKQYYRILSEFMLQQTRVQTVIPYFKNFVKKIPNLKTLSKSCERESLISLFLISFIFFSIFLKVYLKYFFLFYLPN